MGAADGEATENKQSNVEQKEAADTKSASARSQRGVYGSLGDYGHSSHGHSGHGHSGHGSHDFGGQDFGGHDFGASDHHQEHIKTIHIEKKVPVPYTVHKHIPYTVEKKVPYEVKVIIVDFACLFYHLMVLDSF